MIGTALFVIAQAVAGDTAAFGPGVVAAGTGELRLELRRPAYVTVLRVWDDGIELAYPYDPLQTSFWGSPSVASHQMRFGAGQRRVPLAIPWGSAPEVAPIPRERLSSLDVDQHCLMRARAAEAARTGLDSAQRRGAPPLVDPNVACQRTTTVTAPREQRPQAKPEPPSAHQVLVIVSEVRPDLKALSQAVDSLEAGGTALSQVANALLAGHRGTWAAYTARVN